MAEIERINDGLRVTLGTWHTIGRSRSCDLCLSEREISKQHALIAWDGTHWMLRDLHSKNGTWFNNSALLPGRDVPLNIGATFAFGAASRLWRIVSVDAPVARAVSLRDGREVRAVRDLLALPGPDAPEVTVFREAPRGWLLEDSHGKRTAIEDKESILVGDESWRIHLPDPIDETWQGSDNPTPESITLSFEGSMNLEHLRVSYIHNGQVTPLRTRVHHQVLLILANARLRDQLQHNLPEEEHGWMYRDQLANSLKIYDNRLYVYVYRLREQFGQAGVLDAAGIIERRSDTQQVRIGVSRLQIVDTLRLQTGPPPHR